MTATTMTARELNYRGPLGAFPGLDDDPLVLGAAGILWQQQEREAAELVGDQERVEFLDSLTDDGMYGYMRMASDPRPAGAWRAGNPPHIWGWYRLHAIEAARRLVDRAQRMPAREATVEELARKRESRLTSRAIYAGLPAGWVPPDRVRARVGFTCAGSACSAGEVVDTGAFAPLDVWRLLMARKVVPEATGSGSHTTTTSTKGRR